MVKTAEQEAWEENFEKDIFILFKDVLKLLNKNLSLDKKFEFSMNEKYIEYSDDNRNYIRIRVSPGINIKNPKIKYWILIYIDGYNCNKRANVFEDLIVPVTNKESYNKKELERAKNSAFAKILDVINRQW